MAEKPNTFSVRKVVDTWEVLMDEDYWLQCQTEDDARTIARAPVCNYEFYCEHKRGGDFADELERIAKTFRKYKLRYGSGHFQDRADEARQ